MKYFRQILFIAIITLSACSDKNSDYAKIIVDSEKTTLNTSNGIISIDIKASGSWVLTSSEPWLSPTPTSGNSSQTITLAYNANVTKSIRQAHLTLKSGSASDIVTFSQPATIIFDSLSLNSNQGEIASRYEIPKLQETNILRIFKTLEKKDSIVDFVLEWDTTKRHSRWVAFRFDNITSQIKWRRANWESTTWGGDPFQEDTNIQAEYRTTLADYKGSGYDRGHLCASGDRLYSKKANEYTYFLSNMSPQKNSFNSGIWLELENITRQWGYDATLRDTLYVCKGGTIDDNKIMTYVNNMAVPKYYFMAFVAQKNSEFKGIAFKLEHTSGFPTPYDLTKYAISIDELEKFTGIDFFCNLPDSIEEKVEATFDTSLWTWKY